MLRSHSTPVVAELPCAVSGAEAAAVLCFSCDTHVSKHVLSLLFALTRELCLHFLWRRVYTVFVISGTIYSTISYAEV